MIKYLNEKESLQLLWRKKWIMVIIAILTFIISLIITTYNPAAYTSQTTISFIAVNPNIALSVNPVQAEFDRITKLCNDEELINHIIQKFDLVKHYKIDTTLENYQEYVKAKFESNIYLDQQTQISHFVIGIVDEDRFLAAKMANEVAWKLDEMNKKYILSIWEKELAVYDQYISALKDSITILESNLQKVNENSLSVTYTQKDLLTIELDKLFESQIKSKIKYKTLLTSFIKGELSTIYIVREAVPQTLPLNPILNILFIPSIAALISFFISILLIISYETIRSL